MKIDWSVGVNKMILQSSIDCLGSQRGKSVENILRLMGTASENGSNKPMDGRLPSRPLLLSVCRLGIFVRGGTLQIVRCATRTSTGAQRCARGRLTGVVALFSVGILFSLTGCQKPLYLPNDTRTQYDRYHRARNELAPPFVEDEYGRKQSNLRERLGPKG